MQKSKNIKVGIGFATGRKSFQRVLRTNIYNWNESGLVENKRISLNLFVAYDLNYHNTKITDYTNVHPELVEQIDSSKFIGSIAIQEEIDYLIRENVINIDEARMIFGKGYAAKRNAVLYHAIKHNMDYLVFMDDDEYPMAVTNTRKTATWEGQFVLSNHLKYITQADITHGNHCGYISPIPYMEFNDTMTEADFRSFIEVISNDIINWDTLKTVMKNGGVTYADTKILTSDDAIEVQETNHAKFISGANLCINLTDSRRIFPFYNPPGARGEDTFLSTCLSERKVLHVPCYTFHDGFSTYNHLLEGVLPIRLKFIKADTKQITTRFYNACIGWIRYKPLLLYITQPDRYGEKIEEMREQLKVTLPKICAYFGQPDFINVLAELEKYHKNVEKHYRDFLETKRIWAKIMEHFAHHQ
ncbi:hypothetical protein ELQ35_09580 [Peribacillus cavernae]|uniref:Glycosyltransferase family 2 protein n=1 Tax=Peribacillus cavernae TaxID=1674310 RepID=A0A433HQL4_9BACI|nr:hypothetical protein [Peribacillus cavernae]MDQ0216939.1 hypothetical protein [Peribacillus cavernae]RUQ30568.1 hypothetical protein ELQ35_09580 [Peribacillus cavernae]